MGFDPIIASPGRLSILTALAAESAGQEFVHLRTRTRLTDGNLSAHAARLREAGLIEVAKSFRDSRPVTTLRLTPAGRSALEQHARQLLAAVTRPTTLAEPHDTGILRENACLQHEPNDPRSDAFVHKREGGHFADPVVPA